VWGPGAFARVATVRRAGTVRGPGAFARVATVRRAGTVRGPGAVGGATQGRGTEMAGLDLLRTDISAALGDVSAVLAPVIFHRIEPSAGHRERRHWRDGHPVPRRDGPATGASPGPARSRSQDAHGLCGPAPRRPHMRYCDGVSRRSLIRAALPRSDRR